MRRRGWIPVVLAGALQLAGAQVSGAVDDEGQLLYRVHCQACHGQEGRGDGPMKDQLEMSIPDLTTLSERHDGEFPGEQVHWTIDGRHQTPAHGTREMPVWGFTFQSAGRDSDQEAEVQGRITALTLYLESLQRDGEHQRIDDDSGD